MVECVVVFAVVVDIEESNLAVSAGQFDGCDVWVRDRNLFPVISK